MLIRMSTKVINTCVETTQKTRKRVDAYIIDVNTNIHIHYRCKCKYLRLQRRIKHRCKCKYLRLQRRIRELDTKQEKQNNQTQPKVYVAVNDCTMNQTIKQVS